MSGQDYYEDKYNRARCTIWGIMKKKASLLKVVGESPEESDSAQKLMKATLACCNTETHVHFRVPVDNLIADIIVAFLKPLSLRRRVVQKAVEKRRSSLRKENVLLDTNGFRKKIEEQGLTEEKKWVKSMRWLRKNLRMDDGTEEFIIWFHKLMMDAVDDLMTTEASSTSVSNAMDPQPSHHTQPGPSKDPIQTNSETRPSRKCRWDSTEQPQRHNQCIRRTIAEPSSSGTPIPMITIEDDAPGPSTRTNRMEEAWTPFRSSTLEEREERMKPGPSKDPIQTNSETRPSQKSRWDSTELPMQRHSQFIRRTLPGPSSSGTSIPVITIEDDEPGPSTRTNQTEGAWSSLRMRTQEEQEEKMKEQEERMKEKKKILDEAATIQQKMTEFIELNPAIVSAILTEGQKKKAGDQKTPAAIHRVAKRTLKALIRVPEWLDREELDDTQVTVIQLVEYVLSCVVLYKKLKPDVETIKNNLTQSSVTEQRVDFDEMKQKRALFNSSESEGAWIAAFHAIFPDNCVEAVMTIYEAMFHMIIEKIRESPTLPPVDKSYYDSEEEPDWTERRQPRHQNPEPLVETAEQGEDEKLDEVVRDVVAPEAVPPPSSLDAEAELPSAPLAEMAPAVDADEDIDATPVEPSDAQPQTSSPLVNAEDSVVRSTAATIIDHSLPVSGQRGRPPKVPTLVAAPVPATSEPSSSGSQPVKRPRGRPPKTTTAPVPPVADSTPTGSQQAARRGRPPKVNAAAAASVASSTTQGNGVKRGRGRPRKDSLDVTASGAPPAKKAKTSVPAAGKKSTKKATAAPVASSTTQGNGVKRGRGRPRKDSLDVTASGAPPAKKAKTSVPAAGKKSTKKATAAPVVSSTTQGNGVKRGRGRPRKDSLDVTASGAPPAKKAKTSVPAADKKSTKKASPSLPVFGPKRRVGRPRKN